MKLYKHQKEAVTRGGQDNLALFHDPGCGKTLAMLWIVHMLKAQQQTPALVVCPLSIIENAWLADTKKFMPHLSAVSLHFPSGKKKLAKQRKLLSESHDIYVCNFETFKNLATELDKKQFSVLVVDESSKMKNPTTAITRTLLSFAGIRYRGIKFRPNYIIPHRYVLSGTPAPNHEGEYYAQIKFLTGPGNEVFDDNYYAFRQVYFTKVQLPDGRQWWTFRKRMRKQLVDRMGRYVHIVKKKDALDLPEQIHIVRKIQLSEAEAEAYKKLEKTYVLDFKDETVLAETKLAEIMKLRQITSGFVYGHEDTHQIGCSKLDALSDLIDELENHQLIIWINFKAEIATLQKLKSLTGAQILAGDTKDKNAVIQGFQNKKFQYLIANPQTAGHGLTFTNCHYMAYFSLTYSYEYLQQSQDRIHRISQENDCVYYYFLAKNTIDEVIYKCLQTKHSISTAVLEYLKGAISG